MSAIVIDKRGRRYPNTAAVRAALKEATAIARKLGAWVGGCRVNRVDADGNWDHQSPTWQFIYFGDDFTWRGLAANAFDARLKGWEAWITREHLRKQGRA